MRKARPQRDPILSALAGDHVPLAADFDGTLIHGDTLWEALAFLLRRKPLMLFACAAWLLRGKAWFKWQLAKHVPLQPEQLAWNEEAVSFLRMEYSIGRPLFLVTAAPQPWADQVAEYLEIFQGAFGSSENRNNVPHQKRDCCLHLFGDGGFDYLGGSQADVEAMGIARQTLVVGLLGGSRRKPRLKLVLRTLRAYQWCRNLLLFAPVFVGLQWGSPRVLIAAFLGAVAFSLAASCCYLVNDVLDLPGDRQHASKRHRPLASGAAPLWWAFPGALLLAVGAVGVGLLLPHRFLFLMLAYMAGSLAYSFWLKGLLMVDIMALASLYTLRVLAGGAAGEVSVSPWLVLFSVCILSSLAFLKRYIEFAPKEEGVAAARARAYVADDYWLLAAMGVGVSMMSVLVLAMYINSESAKALYSQPSYLWPVCPLLMYWSNRLWLLGRRQAIGEDPMWFVIRDKTSYAVLGAVTLVMLAARFG